METNDFDLQRRGRLAALAALLAVGVCLPPAANAQTLTINSSTPGCIWTTTTVDSHRISNYVCGPSTPQPGTIQFTTNTFPAQNFGATGNFVSVSRAGGTSGALSGTVTVNSGGCVVNGGGAVSFPDGSSATQTVSVTTPGAAGSCSFTLIANGGTSLGAPVTATMPVVDPTTPGAISFASASIAITEAGSAVSIGIARTGHGSQGAAVQVAFTLGSSTAVIGTHFTVNGLTAPGSGSCPSTSAMPGNIGCTTFALGASAPSTVPTIQALSNAGITPTLMLVASIVQPSTVTLGAQSTLNVSIIDAPPVLPENCELLDAHTHLGAGTPTFPLPVTNLAANKVIAFRIAHSLLDGKSVGAFQPTTGMTVAVSNTPCDLGGPTLGTVGAQSLSGCYWNMPGNNPVQLLMKVRTANAFQTCAKPVPASDGSLYVNMSWQGYTNFGQPLVNFCTNSGFTSCNFQFRRDA